MPIDDLPEIITAQHISDYLGISRGKIYTLFQIKPDAGGIPSFDIENSKKVEKKDFVEWIEARKRDKAERAG